MNRIENVRSKYPDVTDINKFKYYLTKDIMGEAEEDQFKWP